MSDLKIKSSIRDYDVLFGRTVSESLQKNLISDDTIIIDRKVCRTFGDDDQKIIAGHKHIILDASEDQKSYLALAPMIEKIIVQKFRRGNRLVAIGGGITQDITAFIASVLYRGVDWIFFPTTLLAQGDSCIGSKTSINFDKYKNQVGGFYPPIKIYIDLEFLNTLTHADQQSGFGEMSHYFVVAGKDDFIDYKEKYNNAVTNKNVMAELVSKSLLIKKKYIEIDEFDQKERQVFNYGHSFGHAIESLTNYSIPHGIAVSFGMDMANFISVKMGLLDPKTRKEIRELLEQIWEGFSIEKIDSKKFCDTLAKDKKNVGKELRLILCKGYGQVFKAPVKNDLKLKNWIMEYFNNEL